MSRPFAVIAFALNSVLPLILFTGCGSSAGIHTFQLTVAIPPSGAGAVTSSPAGISCPAACRAMFAENMQVTLTATPGANYSFGGWSGACSGGGACTLEMTAAESVTANFASSTGGNGMGAAFVYVSGATNGGSDIEGFSVSPDGQLTDLPGSPFPFSIGGLAASGKFLFGTDGTNIYSYAIGKDGSIVQTASIDARHYNDPVDCSGGPQFLFFDRTGTNLYDLDIRSDCANNSYQSFSLDNATGTLTFLADTSDTSPVFERGLQFTGDDAFGFSASCYHFNQEVFGFKRNSNGSLALETSLGVPPPLPSGPEGDPYCPWLAASDEANHLVVSLTPINGSTFEQIGPPQLALYTVDDVGNLSTNSTSSNMPQVAGDTVNDLEISPSGKFLAVGESSGLEVFNFDGANPITQLTGLLTSDAIDEVRWDGGDHLYAISNSSGKLYVFSVNASGAVAVSGSPYPVSSPTDLVVSSGS